MYYLHCCITGILECSDKTASGVYRIRQPTTGNAKDVYCDTETDGGGWTVSIIILFVIKCMTVNGYRAVI